MGPFLPPIICVLFLNFSKILNQKASHEPSGQHVLNDEYYERIEAIQFTMNHDDGNLVKEINKLESGLKAVEKKLSNDKFVNNAPASIVSKEQEKKNRRGWK